MDDTTLDKQNSLSTDSKIGQGWPRLYASKSITADTDLEKYNEERANQLKKIFNEKKQIINKNIKTSKEKPYANVADTSDSDDNDIDKKDDKKEEKKNTI